MPAVPMISGLTTGAAIASNVTTYCSPGGTRSNAFNTTESLRYVTMRTAGTFSKLTVTISANTIATSASTVRLRKDSSNVNNVVSISAGATGTFQDASSTDAVTAGEEWAVQVATPNTSGTLTVTVIGMLFESDTATENVIKPNHRNGGTNAANTTVHAPISGASATSGSANTIMGTTMPCGADFRNLFIQVIVARGIDEVSGIQVNGSASALVVTQTASTTGIFENTADTVTVAAGDLVCFYTAHGASSSPPDQFRAVDVVTDDAEFVAFGFDEQAARSANQTRYSPVGGCIAAFATEAHAQIEALAACTYSDLRVYVPSNTVSATSTLRLRINGGNGSQAVSITSNTTGSFTDASGTDAVVASDAICYSLATGATGTSLTISSVSMLGTFAAAASTVKSLAATGVG